MSAITPPALEFFADLLVHVGSPQDIGPTARGRRRLIPILGGQAQGSDWSARVLPGGADFQLVLGERIAELDARYTLETDAGDLIYVHNRALRVASAEITARLLRGEPVDAQQVYFRCSPRFETASAALGWITERLFIGSGVRQPDSVQMRFFTVS